jgi:hypothetical protein
MAGISVAGCICVALQDPIQGHRVLLERTPTKIHMIRHQEGAVLLPEIDIPIEPIGSYFALKQKVCISNRKVFG